MQLYIPTSIHCIKYTCMYNAEITLPWIPTVILSTFPFTGIRVLLKYIIMCRYSRNNILYYTIPTTITRRNILGVESTYIYVFCRSRKSEWHSTNSTRLGIFFQRRQLNRFGAQSYTPNKHRKASLHQEKNNNKQAWESFSYGVRNLSIRNNKYLLTNNIITGENNILYIQYITAASYTI